MATGLASASAITQTFSFPTTNTDVSDTQTDAIFDYFQSAPGYSSSDVLTSVTFSWSINQTLTTLTFFAPASLSGAQTFSYDQETQVSANEALTTGDGLFGADFTTLTGQTNPPNGSTEYSLYAVGAGTGVCNHSSQGISPGETISFLPTKSSSGGDAPTTCTTGNGTYSYASGVVTSVDPAFYNTTGDFDLSYDTFGLFSETGGASNLNTTVRSSTNDAITVVYNYTISSGTPEPTTMALMGGALIGLGLFGKKRFKKS